MYTTYYTYVSIYICIHSIENTIFDIPPPDYIPNGIWGPLGLTVLFGIWAPSSTHRVKVSRVDALGTSSDSQRKASEPRCMLGAGGLAKGSWDGRVKGLEV